MKDGFSVYLLSLAYFDVLLLKSMNGKLVFLEGCGLSRLITFLMTFVTIPKLSDPDQLKLSTYKDMFSKADGPT